MKEYKIIKVKQSKDFSEAEALMNKMSSEGWEVVSVAQDALANMMVHLIITFAREK